MSSYTLLTVSSCSSREMHKGQGMKRCSTVDEYEFEVSYTLSSMFLFLKQNQILQTKIAINFVSSLCVHLNLCVYLTALLSVQHYS